LGSLEKNYDLAKLSITDGTALVKLNQWVDLSKSAGEKPYRPDKHYLT
jgi:hypothetical protein